MSENVATITLTLPFPPSANEYWKSSRGRGPVPSAEAKAYKAAVARLAVTGGLLPLFGPVTVVLTAYRPRRSGDLDNVLKVMNDALNEVAWLDDDQVVNITAARADDAANPRVELHATAERYASAEEARAHREAREERARKTRETRNRNRKLREAGQLPPKPTKRREKKASTPAPPFASTPVAAPPAWKTPLPPTSSPGASSYGSRHAADFQMAPATRPKKPTAKQLRAMAKPATYGPGESS